MLVPMLIQKVARNIKNQNDMNLNKDSLFLVAVSGVEFIWINEFIWIAAHAINGSSAMLFQACEFRHYFQSAEEEPPGEGVIGWLE